MPFIPSLLPLPPPPRCRLDDKVGTTDYCPSFRIENVACREVTLLGERVILVDDELELEEEEGKGVRTDDLYCQRVYRFSVEVWPAPSGSVFRHTKVRSGFRVVFHTLPVVPRPRRCNAVWPTLLSLHLDP